MLIYGQLATSISSIYYYIRSSSGPIGSNQTEIIISGYTFTMTQIGVK